MRAYALGDIHGHLRELERVHGLIAEDRARAGDATAPVVHIGDLCDRGPDTRGVLDFLIEGQARGIAKMMEDDRYCIDILQQMTAMEAALRSARAKVLGIHADHCIEDAVQSGNVAEQREKFGELIALFGKVGR